MRLPIYAALLTATLLCACASTPSNKSQKKTATKTAQKKPETSRRWADRQRAFQQGAADGSITRGKEGGTETLFRSEIHSEMSVQKLSSQNAKTCEQKARINPAKADWLAACDAALAEPALSPQNRRASQFNRALILQNLGRGNDARTALAALLKSEPKFADVPFELARMEFAEANYDKTIAYARQALSLALRKPARAHNIIGRAYEKDFRYAEALAAYEKAELADPGAGETRRNLARLDRVWAQSPRNQNQP